MGSAISTLVFQPPPATFLHNKKHFWLQTRNQHRIPVFHVDRRCLEKINDLLGDQSRVIGRMPVSSQIVDSQVTVLFSHGNAEDLGLIYEWFYDFSRQLNVNVLAYEYSGYGKSEGTVSEDNCYADIRAAYDYLTTQKKTPPEQIVLYGRSLGSGPTCQLAEELAKDGVRLGGVMLQSPLASAFRVAFNFRFTMPGDLFPNIDRVKGIACPVFIIHGTRDEVVPFWHGQELFLGTPTKWRAKPFWVDGAGHNNIEALLREDGTLFERMNDFLDKWVRSDLKSDFSTSS